MVNRMGNKRILIGLAAVVIILGGAAFVLRGKEKTASANNRQDSHAAAPSVVAAPGRIEPISEDVRLGSEISGKLAHVLAEEGDRVHKGQLMAVLVNDDYRAEVASAEATLAEKDADERKTIHGARTEERREALAAVKAQEAVVENAKADMDRHQKLYEEGVLPREDADHYLREYKVAKAQYDQAMQHFRFIDEETREEDQAHAASDVRLARAQLEETRARFEKTFIRAPIDGVVLRRHHRAGESVTNSANSPDPIFTIGDRQVLRVRVDVDETDIARVRVGGRAYITADAFGSRQFWGRVVRIGGELGRKNVRTDEPTERVDTKILEVLVELEDGRDLPVGLRVDTFILVLER
jgi:HlyD family secretion protein